jgi:WD40 repeat protein
MSGHFLARALVCTLLLSSSTAFGQQADRQQRLHPGLMLETGVRQGSCDELQFARVTVGGQETIELLGAGDDKVVRIFGVQANQLTPTAVRTLRWPIYRENRGHIFAMALSHDQTKVAIAGYGVRARTIALLDRVTGDVLALGYPTEEKSEVIWRLAFSKDDKKLIAGTHSGELWLWHIAAEDKPMYKVRAAVSRNEPVRLVHFTSDDDFLFVTDNGRVQHGLVIGNKAATLTDTGRRFTLPNPFRVAISGNGRFLAAVGAEKTVANANSGAASTVELIDSDKGTNARVQIPEEYRNERPTSLAFDVDGERLAIGTYRYAKRINPEATGPDDRWLAERFIGGKIFICDVKKTELVDQKPCDAGYIVECLAFHPTNRALLASAGGNNHEVRLWDLNSTAKPVSETNGPGRSIWSVRFSKGDAKLLAFHQQRTDLNASPNLRGAGPWRFFDLKERRFIPTWPEKDLFQPIASANGWQVGFTAVPSKWRVFQPQTKRDYQLYLDTEVFGSPSCFTFIPAQGAKPLRLALGHKFGISVYEIPAEFNPKQQALFPQRIYFGHEGDVMSIAPSENGEMLASASRDMTICGWTLSDWPAQKELGARFKKEGDAVKVEALDPGSPAWEAGLQVGDRLIAAIVNRRPFKHLWFDPLKTNLTTIDDERVRRIFKDFSSVPEAQKETVNADGLLEYFAAPLVFNQHTFVWERGGKSMSGVIQIIQRPLWRFFPMRNDQWLAWRWRDYYYARSEQPNVGRMAGWQVHTEGKAEKPDFYYLGENGFKERFYNEKALDLIFRSENARPEMVQLPEKPIIRWFVTKKPSVKKGTDAVISVTVTPRFKPRSKDDFQNLKQASVTIQGNETFRLAFDPSGKQSLTIARAELRQGQENMIVIKASNLAGSEGEQLAPLSWDD